MHNFKYIIIFSFLISSASCIRIFTEKSNDQCYRDSEKYFDDGLDILFATVKDLIKAGFDELHYNSTDGYLESPNEVVKDSKNLSMIQAQYGLNQSMSVISVLLESVFGKEWEDKLSEFLGSPIGLAFMKVAASALPHVEMTVGKALKPPNLPKKFYKFVVRPLIVRLFNRIEQAFDVEVDDDIWNVEEDK